MEYSDKNEHLNDDPLENTSKAPGAPTGNENEHSPAIPPENSKEQAGSPVNEHAPGTGAEDTYSARQENDEGNDPSHEPEKNDELPGEARDTSGKTSSGGPAEQEGETVVGTSDDASASDTGNQEDGSEAKEDATDEGKPASSSKGKKEKAEKKEKTEKSEKAEKKENTEEEKINYELLSKPDLVKLLEDLLGTRSFSQLRNVVDEIQEVFQKKVDQEYAEKKEKFIAGGGPEQDFKPVEDAVDKLMEELLDKYKTLKADYNKQLEEEKETNLKTKEEILEEFRLLMEGQEGFDAAFRKFKQLQKRWFDVGIVPKQNVRDLWNSYNFFVEKFNDYVRINKELRVLDLKKNLDLKLKLCEKAEELVEEKNISAAFKTLQKYHSQWREIGPVPREDKDAIWERFKSATSVINKAHQQFQSELRGSLEENLEKKKILCDKAEAIAALDLDKHNEWVRKTNELLDIQKEWKTIGYAPKKENNQIYARFRRACDTFFDRKASFYARTFEHQKENLDRKLEIIRTAEELRDSKDWKSTTDKLIDLQNQWKEIGPVPRKDSDRLWRRFRTACDHYFNAKSEFFGGKNESYEANLKEKQALISEMNSYQPPENKNELLSALDEFQLRYNGIGFVPVEVKVKIRDDFKKAVDDLIDKTGATDEEKTLIRYRIRITAIMNSPRSENKIRFERDKLVNKLQQLRNDIGVWENNIGFFKQTESSEDTLSEFNEKIEDAHVRIRQMEQKIRIIDEIEDSM
ncbi:MAG: DUF349 domain-containing protein [Bacteroidales bacterium]|nr:DUF349 domain-containing protein [Bacteroidales bacterium]